MIPSTGCDRLPYTEGMATAKRKGLLRPGERAPEFRLPLLGGGESSLTDLIASGPVLLAFFKVSCPVCQLTFPYLERIHAAGTLPVYGVSQNGTAETRDFNRAFGVTFPTLLDPEGSFPASNAFGLANVPTLFLVERDGAVAKVIDGWSKADIQSLGAKAGANPFRDGEYVPEWKAG